MFFLLPFFYEFLFHGWLERKKKNIFSFSTIHMRVLELYEKTNIKDIMLFFGKIFFFRK